MNIINTFTFHFVVAVFLLVITYRRTMEFIRLKKELRAKDEIIKDQMNLLKKLKGQHIYISNGDYIKTNVDQSNKKQPQQ